MEGKKEGRNKGKRREREEEDRFSLYTKAQETFFNFAE